LLFSVVIPSETTIPPLRSGAKVELYTHYFQTFFNLISQTKHNCLKIYKIKYVITKKSGANPALLCVIMS
ncbi:hypothetical protein ACR78T_21415, partial [Sphingobacterium spiritivorum]